MLFNFKNNLTRTWSQQIGYKGIMTLLLFIGLFSTFLALLIPAGLPIIRISNAHFTTYIVVIFFCAVLLLLTDKLRRLPQVLSYRLALGTFIISFILFVTASTLTGVVYWALKPAIPLLNTSNYDIFLESFERWIFGGKLPSLWLIERIDTTYLALLDNFYFTFTPYLTLSALIALYKNGFSGGLHFTLATSTGLLTCLLIALIFPSYGPIFTHKNTFNELSNLPSGILADYLLKTVQTYQLNPESVPVIAGVAAMPSYHVYAWACATSCWKTLPKPLYVTSLFSFFLNWFCTVALGWHYFLDGLIALLLFLLLWPLTEKVAANCKSKSLDDSKCSSGRDESSRGNAPSIANKATTI